MGEGLDRALQIEAEAQAVCYGKGDYREGLLAVKEKRKPVFGGFEEG